MGILADGAEAAGTLAFGAVPFVGVFTEVAVTLVLGAVRMLNGEVGAADAFALEGMPFVGVTGAVGTFAFEVVALVGVLVAEVEATEAFTFEGMVDVFAEAVGIFAFEVVAFKGVLVAEVEATETCAFAVAGL